MPRGKLYVVSGVRHKDTPIDGVSRASNSRQSSSPRASDIADMIFVSKPQQEDVQASPTDERYTILVPDAVVIFRVLAQKRPK